MSKKWNYVFCLVVFKKNGKLMIHTNGMYNETKEFTVNFIKNCYADNDWHQGYEFVKMLKVVCSNSQEPFCIETKIKDQVIFGTNNEKELKTHEIALLELPITELMDC